MAEQIRGPLPPDYHYERVIDGQVVETWTPDAGPVRAALNTTRIGDDGVPVSPISRQVDPITASHAGAPQSSDPRTMADLDQSTGSDTAPTWTPVAQDTTQSTRQTSQFQTRPMADMATDPLASLPPYQGGAMHPASPMYQQPQGALGDRIAGQVAGPLSDLGGRIASRVGAQPSDGFRETIHSDAGWAGPGGAGVYGGASVSGGQVQTARPDYPSGSDISRMQQERGYSPPGNDHGGQTRDIISSIRGRVMAKGNAMEAKVRGMASKIGGGGGATTSSGGYGGGDTAAYRQQARQYKEQQRRAADRQKHIDDVYKKFQDEFYNPDPPKVVGWAKDQGYKRGAVEAAMTNPTYILGDVFKDKGGYTSNNTFGDRFIESLPMTDIALAQKGATGHGLTTKIDVPKLPGILDKAGYEEPKLMYKREVNPSKVVNTMAKGYDTIRGPGDTWFDTNELLGNLQDVGKNSAVGLNFRQAWDADPGSAMRNAENLVSNVLSTRVATPGNIASQRLVGAAATNLGGDILRTKYKRPGIGKAGSQGRKAGKRYYSALAGAFDRS